MTGLTVVVDQTLLRFTVLTSAASLLWNAVLIGAVIALGSNWHVVERVVGRYAAVIPYTLSGNPIPQISFGAATVVLLLIVLVARWLRRRSDL